MDLNCLHFRECSGCTQNLSLEQPPLLKEALALYPFTFETGSLFNWRTKAKLAVRAQGIGLFKRGSHEVIPIPHCRVHHPLINQILFKLNVWCREAQVIPYNERLKKGQLRYIQLHVERHTKRVQLVLVVNEEISSLPKDLPLHSLWINRNQENSNVIFSRNWELISGEPYLIEKYLGSSICYHPGSFAQANPEMFERLLFDLNQLVPIGAKVLDLYSGVGVIGFLLAKKGRSVVCVESHSSVLNPFLETKKQLNLSIEMKIGLVEEFQELLNGVDVVVVDPPRSGLDESTIVALGASKTVKEVYYISCGFMSYKRDALRLKALGFIQTFGKAYLFFPGTDHIELLTCWKRG
jgi:tRNA/tmRNA/rRNA uracil-C5-methylase (TrmA/RlmC/RlmD family)